MATAFHGIAHQPREWRRKVAIPARVHSGSEWGDGQILNISSRGMLLQFSRPLSVGSEIEVCQGGCQVPATVVWREGFRTGIAAAEPIVVADWVSASLSKTGGLSLVGPASAASAARWRKRESAQWRALGRQLQHYAIVGLAAALVIAVAALAARTLFEPLARVSTLLG